jgi:hypothetical protein
MNKTLFLIWFGGLENMSANRKKCLDSIYQHAGVDIVLITEDNLNHWLVEPLHPAFEYLSLTHKADYLRSYLMHFYGGDIFTKPPNQIKKRVLFIVHCPIA